MTCNFRSRVLSCHSGICPRWRWNGGHVATARRQVPRLGASILRPRKRPYHFRDTRGEGVGVDVGLTDPAAPELAGLGMGNANVGVGEGDADVDAVGDREEVGVGVGERDGLGVVVGVGGGGIMFSQ